MNLKRIHIIDDELVIRESMSEWLSKNYEVHTFSSAEKYLKAMDQFDQGDAIPTCILLDFQMPGINGVELQKTLKRLNSKFPIIFMSGNALQADIIDAWRGGAFDFILKPFGPSKINEILDNQFILMEKSITYNDKATDRKPEIHIPITRREAQILLLLGKGHSQLEVAQQLGISLNTVKMYRSFLRDKLDLNNLAELIQFFNKHQESIEKIANK